MTIDEVKIPRFHTALDAPRVIGQYRVAGPKTFRRSCRMLLGSKKKTYPFANFGTNMQNWESSMRQICVADKGYKMVQVDQSGADALIVAYTCRAGKYRKLFENGIKPHTYIALKLFKEEWKKHVEPSIIDLYQTLPIEELAKHPEWKKVNNLIKGSDKWPPNKRYYYIGKKVVHAGSYGMMGPRMVQVVLEETGGIVLLSKKDAETYIITFKQIEFPEIAEWNVKIGITAEKDGVIRNLFGYPFNITGKLNSNDMKDLIAFGPQSTVAGITEQALCDLQDYIEENNKDWHILAETHDSILAECPDGEEQELGKMMKQFIEIELTSPTDGVKFRMRSEAVTGYNWGHYDEKENPQGLQELKIAA